jgi:hypothetical protein
MADKQLYPVFDVPEITAQTTPEKEHYKPSVYFDFAAGDFTRDGANRMVEATGKEAYAQWCMKIIATERDTCLAYSTRIGTEMEYAAAQPDHASVEASVERTVIEALMVNPKTEYVRDFVFTWSGTTLSATFKVKGLGLDEIKLALTVESS